MGAAIPDSQSLSWEIDSEGFKVVAGRAIGGDRIAHAATRNMACCAVTGQAAGIAAALSVRSGRPFHELDPGLIQAELDRQGVRHQ
jgi:FAD dependent oxidoreductase